MTAVENYSFLINEILGFNATKFDVTKTHTNRVIGALNNEQFEIFKKNFIARLKRLNQIYAPYPKYWKEVITQINEIQSEKNWEGAFAELAAYDHLNSDDITFKPIIPNITLPQKKSFAKELGKQKTNVDGLINDFSVYFDVKCLKDNNEEILKGIYDHLKEQLNLKNVHFLAEYSTDISYEVFQKNRTLLFNELKAFITTKGKPSYFQSDIVPHLNIRILWNGGVVSGIRGYDPYKHAGNFHKSIFNYTNKFIKSKPSIIVLVVFPWYNLVVSDFIGCNVEFYRSFCRRFFCQYMHSRDKFNSFNSSFTGNQTLYSMSKYLSGIIILEDNSILSKEHDSTNIKAYTFLNPNAKNPINGSMATTYLNQITNGRFDDFHFDNY